jgi:hypothetical protein
MVYTTLDALSDAPEALETRLELGQTSRLTEAKALRPVGSLLLLEDHHRQARTSTATSV